MPWKTKKTTRTDKILDRGLKEAKKAAPPPPPDVDPIYDCLRLIYKTIRLLRDRPAKEVERSFAIAAIAMPPRSKKDPIRKMVEAVLRNRSAKMKGKYANALNWALLNNIQSNNLTKFINEQGGFNACTTALRRRKKTHQI